MLENEYLLCRVLGTIISCPSFLRAAIPVNKETACFVAGRLIDMYPKTRSLSAPDFSVYCLIWRLFY
jgi:hypothetical protein